MPGFFLNQDLATSAGRPLPEVCNMHTIDCYKTNVDDYGTVD